MEDNQTLDSFSEKTEKSDKPEKKTKSSDAKAHELAKSQREISIAEFFEKNRHLLGFDNKRKALLTTIKEAVDNSLDACEEADVLPEISVEITEMGTDRYKVVIEDNGPGIIKSQIPKIFAKLLYGSKFHKLKMQRGQQGIGISAAVMYGQLTTGKPAKILSKIHPDEPAHYYELKINTQKNDPEIIAESTKEWHKENGTRIELELEASYMKGNQSVDEYIKETAIINPHVTLIYQPPKGDQIMLVRVTDKKPKLASEIKPHPYGVELGMLIKMMQVTTAKTIKQFLMQDFSRIGDKTAEEILENSSILSNTKLKDINRDLAEKLIDGIRKTKIMMPPTDCIVPIGAELLEKGLKKEVNAEFYTSVSRSPDVYRGNPFLIEASLAYGGDIPKEGSLNLMRFANRVPLLYQQGACAVTEGIMQTNWKQYGLQQSGSNMPQGPVVLVVHIASVWVPFTSEAKEAIAHYPEIIKEIKLAVQEIGRNLSKYLNKKRKVGDELKKRSYIEIYIPHIADALKEILKYSDSDKLDVEKKLEKLLEKTRGKIEDMKFDPTKNEDYDEDLAKIGKDNYYSDEDSDKEDEDD
ncbi:DNA topoisomerase VI subunit B [Candidatus Woesearchaeota archaeon CG10_big_fil_rev_8_21_14_0_10_32_9]|nr:MAG: DNA topoisomerase VI subunit B [Candidatus Woesearchaeota archaeon CG10_big_fil_rev_8_21_14_0_10_32_9]